MMPLPQAEFRTNLPDDDVWDGDEIARFSGLSLAEAVAGLLSDLGYDVSAPIHAFEHGWELDARAKGRRFWLQLTRMGGDECLLITQDMTWQFWRTRPRFEDFLVQLDGALRSDPRITELAWCRNLDDSARSQRPVVGD